MNPLVLTPEEQRLLSMDVHSMNSPDGNERHCSMPKSPVGVLHFLQMEDMSGAVGIELQMNNYHLLYENGSWVFWTPKSKIGVPIDIKMSPQDATLDLLESLIAHYERTGCILDELH